MPYDDLYEWLPQNIKFVLGLCFDNPLEVFNSIVAAVIALTFVLMSLFALKRAISTVLNLALYITYAILAASIIGALYTRSPDTAVSIAVGSVTTVYRIADGFGLFSPATYMSGLPPDARETIETVLQSTGVLKKAGLREGKQSSSPLGSKEEAVASNWATYVDYADTVIRSTWSQLSDLDKKATTKEEKQGYPYYRAPKKEL